MGDATSVVQEIQQVAAEQPLDHPLAFSMSQLNFELAPPGHLVDIYQSVYEGLNQHAYPNSFQNIAFLEPRDHGKSEVGSHVIPSWKVLEDPNSSVLIMMESETQAKAKLSECSDTINRVGPAFGREIVNDSATELRLDRDVTRPEPSIKAVGFETSVTGGHYDVIVYDDLISDDSVITEDSRKKTWNKFQERLNLRSGEDAVILVLGTRKHPDDMYDKLLKSPRWDVTVERAIKDWSIVENGEYDVVAKNPDTGEVKPFDANERPNNWDIVRVEPHREAEVLWPDRYALSSLIENYLSGSLDDEMAKEKGLTGSRVWVRENQNKANALMGEVLSEDMLTFVDGPPGDKELESMPCYAGLDPANEADPEKAATGDMDYFAWAVAYYDPSNTTFYVDDIRRKRGITMKKACEWVEKHMRRYPTNNIYVEANMAQNFLIQELRDNGLFAKEVDSTSDKEARIKQMSARFESGKAVINGKKAEPKWDSFIDEWVEFPSSDHDDRLDAVEKVLSSRSQEDEEAKKTARRPFV